MQQEAGIALETRGHHVCFWTMYMFVHADLTVAFQVQITCENKKQSRNWSTSCFELSCSCNISPEAVSGSSFARALRLQRSTQHLVPLCSDVYFWLARRKHALPCGHHPPAAGTAAPGS